MPKVQTFVSRTLPRAQILVTDILPKVQIFISKIALNKIFVVILVIMVIIGVPVGIVTCCYFIKTLKIAWNFIAFVIGTFFMYLYLSFSVKGDFLDSTVGSMLGDLILDRIYQYRTECKEVYFSHKLGVNFNKEYFDLYHNRKSIVYRLIYYLACLSTMLYVKLISKVSVGDISFLKELLDPIVNDRLSKFFLDFYITFIVFIILLVLSNAILWVAFKKFSNYIPFEKNIKKLLKTKGEDFGPYTNHEDTIISG